MQVCKRASSSSDQLLISSAHSMPKKRRVSSPSRMAAAEHADQNPPQTSTSGDNGEIIRRREQENSSPVALRFYVRHRLRQRSHLHQLSDEAVASSSSNSSPPTSHQAEINFTVVIPEGEKEKEEARAALESQQQPRNPTSSSPSSSSRSLQQAEQGQEKKAGDMFDVLSASPNEDFEDFKTVRKLQLNQIWALNDHGHVWAPRTYARIHRFLPTQFKVEVALLDFHPTCDDDASWCERNLPVACGTFKLGKSMLVRDVYDLSHRVFGCEEEGNRSERSFHRILPRKGQVWALYRDWNLQWSHADYEQHLSDFKLVEIMSDLSEVDGVLVAALVPAEACLTVFQRQTHEGFELLQWISKSCLLQFSHRVVAVGRANGSWLINPAFALSSINLNLNIHV